MLFMFLVVLSQHLTLAIHRGGFGATGLFKAGVLCLFLFWESLQRKVMHSWRRSVWENSTPALQVLTIDHILACFGCFYSFCWHHVPLLHGLGANTREVLSILSEKHHRDWHFGLKAGRNTVPCSPDLT